MNPKYKIIDLDRDELISKKIGRCTFCDAQDICDSRNEKTKCLCNMSQHYVDINKLRKKKLNKLKNL